MRYITNMKNKIDHKVTELISSEEINKIVINLATVISRDFANQEVMLVGVLDGAFAFTTDLSRALHKMGMQNMIIDFVGIDTYGFSTTSSKEPRITKDLKHDIRDKVVLIVEDIVDTGYSLSVLQSLLNARLPRKLATVALLSKDSRREIDVPVEYIGKQIPDVFVVGYGLDYDGKYYRELPFIGVITK